MSAFQSLVDILRQILQALQVHTLFPAATLVIGSYLLAPEFNIFNQKIDKFDISIIFIIMIILLSNMLAAFNGIIIKFLEGYTYTENRFLYYLTRVFFNFMKSAQIKKYNKIKQALKKCDEDLTRLSLISTYYKDMYLIDNKPFSAKLVQIRELKDNIIERRNLLQIELDSKFAPNRILPTSFGNTILAFEYYPMMRYRMDSIYLWPCLLPILEKNKFSNFLNNEKSRLDFLLNSGVVCIILCIEALFWFLSYRPYFAYLGLCSALVFLTCFLYIASVFAANDWGIFVKAAFDLYRDDLHKTLHLKPLPDGNIEKEREVWLSVSEFLALGESEKFKGFFYSKSLNKKVKVE